VLIRSARSFLSLPKTSRTFRRSRTPRDSPIFNRGNHPFSALADRTKIDGVLSDIERLQRTVSPSCHSPMARRGRIAPHLKQLSELIGMEPLLGPDQVAFEALLASMAGRSHAAT
jgi:hypothetical protein